MEQKVVYRNWAIYLCAALILQMLGSTFPLDFFEFPVNIAFLLLGVVTLWILYRERRQSYLCRLLLAPETTFLLLAASFVSCLIMGFTSWLSPSSWWFVLLMVALLAHLFLVTFRGLSRKRPYRWRFALNHIGLFLLLTGGLVGAPDKKECRMLVSTENSTREAFSEAGVRLRLPHTLQLEQFDVAYYANGMPQDYEARLNIDGRTVLLRVNHPYSLSWQDNLYLLDYEHVPRGYAPRYCILQLVREPWKYVEYAGICLLLAGAVLLFVQGVPVYRKGGAAA